MISKEKEVWITELLDELSKELAIIPQSDQIRFLIRFFRHLIDSTPETDLYSNLVNILLKQ